MSYLVKNIEYLLAKNHINAHQLQEKSNIPQSTTFRIINGDTKSPSSNTVKKYADYFGVSEADLRYEDLSDKGDNFKRQFVDNMRLVPVLNYVQAGQFCEYYDAAIADSFEPVTGDYSSNVYWIVVEGLSMVPDFNSGDLVLINPDVQPNPGDYVVAIKQGEKMTTFKKWRPRGFDNDGVEYFELVPSNPDFPIIDSRRTPFTVCGVAMERKEKLR